MYKGFYFILLAAILNGCNMIVGTAFIKPTAQMLVLGKTTESEVYQHIGQPYSLGSIKGKSGLSVTDALYWYGTSGSGYGADEVLPRRTLNVFFYKNVLVGYTYSSSYKEDNTNFDESKIDRIKQGQMKGDVTEILGEPSGYTTYPLNDSLHLKSLVYSYDQVKEKFNPKIHYKFFAVVLDTNDRVIETKFAEQGEK